MKIALLVLSILFAILTFIGVGYILLNDGRISIAYAGIPFILEICCIAAYKKSI
ncbi:hypothetical protein [Candidatus Epulonipiscium viviparus]|uniref:hypothetical protein n=1 Tax=Candidatus Epulonipiscium viviparus TaxID=420336 RepID=UPI00016BFB6C|nr:hypothetical protein [Candidatus Epulopiscium viviparus]